MADSDDDLRSLLAGRYRLDRLLGRGGMAMVYLAHDLRHDRPVALKVLLPEVALALGPERFLREIQLSGRLQHPHILAVHDSGDAAGRLWFTMPYIEGETLRSRLAREFQLPVADALRIALEVADALQYAHQHGVVHRDIKPENILLSGQHASVADFGIARGLAPDEHERLTVSGLSIGTPHYMSPEQALAQDDIDQRSDIYSLGCVLYEMLVGEPPFTGATPQVILAKRLSEPVPHVRTQRDVSPALERAVLRALARVPADRFASMADFRAAIAPERHLSEAAERIAPHHASSARSAWRVPMLAGILVLVVLAGFFLRRRPAGLTAHIAPAASAAVLPFVDLSPQHDQEYFSDGLTEELITALSQVPGLRIAARTSSFQFKGQNPDVHDVGRRLEVATVIEGSVRRSGNRVRVTAQLIDANDGYQLWSNSYDRDLADVFAVQEEVARSIVQALSLRLAAAPDSALASYPTQDLDAYDSYLKGLFAWNQRTGPAMREAVRYLQQAVSRDPEFSRAWAALAQASILVVPYAGVPAQEGWPQAELAARRAIALDSMSAEAYTALAYGNMIYAWNWEEADRNFRRAIAANPNYATAHHWYGDFLAGRGRLTESESEMERAHQLDPLSRQIGVEWGWVAYLMHHDSDAEARIREVLALEPNYAQAHLRLGFVQIQQRRFPEALRALHRSIDLGVFYPHAAAGLALAYAGAGAPDSVLAVVRVLERSRTAGELVPPLMIAVAYGAAGDLTRGFEWLNRGIEERDLYMPENLFEPMLDPLRGDQRFDSVLRRLEIAPAGTPTS